MDTATIGDGRGLVTRLENLVASLPERAAALQRQLDSAQRDADEARIGLGAPFPRAGELATARARLQSIEERLAKTLPERAGRVGVGQCVKRSWPDVCGQVRLVRGCGPEGWGRARRGAELLASMRRW
ncbi:hypothetical protein GCM10009811_05480 [Nostocoides veronense]|uniref:Uncharacterized protein n=1 Tax=Nostocoides veronense TaxID=330836 RepID=A0ABP4XNL6_9MICO